eukprot:4049625-Pyramimonas_sp.AAC.1
MDGPWGALARSPNTRGTTARFSPTYPSILIGNWNMYSTSGGRLLNPTTFLRVGDDVGVV